MANVPPEVRTAQARAEAALQGRPVPTELEIISDDTAPVTYAGLVTRTIAFALDASVINACALVVGVVVGLGLSILHLPEQVDVVVAAILAALWVLWSVGYFAFFWSTTGQTPGCRAMRILVLDSTTDGTLKPRRALVRFGGLIAAAIPLCAGFLMMLWDERRRCLQDRLARSVVVDGPPRGERANVRGS